MPSLSEDLGGVSNAGLNQMLQRAGFSPFKASEITNRIWEHFRLYREFATEFEPGSGGWGAALKANELPRNPKYYGFTTHAENRLGQRNISRGQVKEAFQHGTRQHAKGKLAYRFIHKETSVVVVVKVNHHRLEEVGEHPILTVYRDD